MNKSTIEAGQPEQVINSEQTIDNQQVSPSSVNAHVIGCVYRVTPHLRYVRKHFESHPSELRLQQMWQGNDGSQKWEFIEEVNIHIR
jgi:hypothetical protein